MSTISLLLSLIANFINLQSCMPFARKSHMKINQITSFFAVLSGWEPFNGDNGTQLLGYLDVAFLAVYAIGMFFSGHIRDRINLKSVSNRNACWHCWAPVYLQHYLDVRIYWFNIRNFYYYLILATNVCWYSLIYWMACCGSYGRLLVGKGWSRFLLWGFGMLIHRLVISLVLWLHCLRLLKYGWGWSMFVPSMIIWFIRLIVFLLLPVSPSTWGKSMRENQVDSPNKDALEELLGFWG